MSESAVFKAAALKRTYLTVEPLKRINRTPPLEKKRSHHSLTLKSIPRIIELKPNVYLKDRYVSYSGVK